MTIPVVVVDDEEFDRYVVRRRLAKNGRFSDLVKMPSGDKFLETYFSEQSPTIANDKPLLILMDINMPGSDGFETIEEIQRRLGEGGGLERVIVMMISSSSNLDDRSRADELDIVKGYITKPLDVDGVDYILDTYMSGSNAQQPPV